MKRETVFYDGEPVGIVVPHEGLLKFIAVKFHVIDMDTRTFRTIAELKKAIKSHLEMPVAA